MELPPTKAITAVVARAVMMNLRMGVSLWLIGPGGPSDVTTHIWCRASCDLLLTSCWGARVIFSLWARGVNQPHVPTKSIGEGWRDAGRLMSNGLLCLVPAWGRPVLWFQDSSIVPASLGDCTVTASRNLGFAAVRWSGIGRAPRRRESFSGGGIHPDSCRLVL